MFNESDWKALAVWKRYSVGSKHVWNVLWNEN